MMRQMKEAITDRIVVAGRYDITIVPVDDQIGSSGPVRNDGRDTARHRLCHDVAKVVGQRRVDQHAGLSIDLLVTVAANLDRLNNNRGIARDLSLQVPAD